MNLGPSLRYGIPVTILATVLLCALAFNIPPSTPQIGVEGPVVSLNCEEVPLSEAAQLFSRASGRQVLLTYAVANATDASKVTINYDAVPWREALGHLARTAGCIAIEDPTEIRPTYHLTPYESTLRGDTNGDGNLSMADFVELARQLPNSTTNKEFDVDASGQVDINDTVVLIHDLFATESAPPELFPQYDSVVEDTASAYERGAILARTEVESGSYRLKIVGFPVEQLCDIQEQLDYFVELDAVDVYNPEVKLFVKGYNDVVREAFKQEFGDDVVAWISQSFASIGSLTGTPIVE